MITATKPTAIKLNTRSKMNCICYTDSKKYYTRLKEYFEKSNSPILIKLLDNNSFDNSSNTKPRIFHLSEGKNCNSTKFEKPLAIIIPYDKVCIKSKEVYGCLPIITYGLSSRATVACSSITEDSLMISLQRSIKTIFKSTLEPFEIKYSMPSIQNDITLAMIAASIEILLKK